MWLKTDKYFINLEMCKSIDKKGKVAIEFYMGDNWYPIITCNSTEERDMLYEKIISKLNIFKP